MKSKNERLSLLIDGESVMVRKGTSDLKVAIDTFSGEFDVLKMHLAQDFDGVIIDAGGYIGTAAIALERLFPQLKIYSIEASKENYELLVANTEKKENIFPVWGALVGKHREAVILKERKTGAWGYSVVDDPADDSDPVDLYEVQCLTLSQVAGSQKIGVLKLDIEGGELDLLQNDSQTLHSIPVIFAELHERILPGTTEAFETFCLERIKSPAGGEKYLTLKNN